MNYDNIKIKANGVVLPPPISMDINLEDIDIDSERDTKNAKMKRNRLRSDIFKFSLVYAINDIESVSTVLKAIEPVMFPVEVFDIKNNKRVTKNMYAGPKSMQFVCNNGVWVKGLKFNLMEE